MPATCTRLFMENMQSVAKGDPREEQSKLQVKSAAAGEAPPWGRSFRIKDSRKNVLIIYSQGEEEPRRFGAGEWGYEAPCCLAARMKPAMVTPGGSLWEPDFFLLIVVIFRSSPSPGLVCVADTRS